MGYKLFSVLFYMYFYGWNRTSSHFIHQMPQVFTKILFTQWANMQVYVIYFYYTWPVPVPSLFNFERFGCFFMRGKILCLLKCATWKRKKTLGRTLGAVRKWMLMTVVYFSRFIMSHCKTWLRQSGPQSKKEMHIGKKSKNIFDENFFIIMLYTRNDNKLRQNIL